LGLETGDGTVGRLVLGLGAPAAAVMI
jgi:hypothetical protein